MSAPIRPLPVEAAPQRTESDAPFNSKPDEGPGFGEVLDLHLDEKVEDTKEQPKQEPEKKPKDVESSAWALLGVQLATPAVFIQTTQVERGDSCPQDQSAKDLLVEAPPLSVLTVSDQPPSHALADKNVRAPAPPGQKSPPDLSSLLQKLAPSPEEQKLPPEVVPKQEELAGKTAETGEKLRGITVAKQVAVLLNAEKQDTSGSLEQQGRFQVPQMEAASEQVRVTSRPLPKSIEHPVEFPAEKAISDSANFSPSIRVETPSLLADTHGVTEARAVAVVESIREHVLVLRVSQANELNVVLRPDANTELLLQLRHVDGQVHLQARCERGDFTWLDSQWNAIQNTLAQQGVRVDPLQAAYHAQDGGGNSMFMPDERGSRQREEQNFSFEQESSKTSKNTSRPASSGARMRGWQSWA